MADNGSVNFDTALEKIGGFGRFHRLFLLCMLPSHITGILIVNTLTYMMPAVACDMQIPKYNQGLLFSSTYIGMIMGGLIWGVASDILGRRATLLILLFSTAVSEAATAFTSAFWTLFCMKTFAGFMGAGIVTTYYTYASEFITTRDKYKITMGTGMQTALGFFVQALIALFTLPLEVKYTIIPNVLVLNDWKLFQLICALFPAAGFLLLLFTLDESPAFLLRQGREKEAIKVLKSVYAKNTNNSPDSFNVEKLYIEEEANEGSNEPSSFMYRASLLLSHPYVIPVTLVVLCECITMGSFAGVRAHLATIITLSLGIGQKSNTNVTEQRNRPLCKLFENQVLFNNKVDCSLGKVKLQPEIYVYTTIIGFFIFVSFLPMITVVRKLGKPFSFVALHYIGGICVSAMPFAQAYATVILLAIYSLCMQNCVTICVALIVARVPTIIRGITISLLLIGGRIGVLFGDMILPIMTEISCPVGFWSIGILNWAALPLLVLFVKQPNPSREDL